MSHDDSRSTAPVSHRKGLLALSPLMVFLLVYFVSSLVVGDFYKIPVSAAFLLACIYGVAICRPHDVNDNPGSQRINARVGIFSRGAANGNVLLMIWIFILAGAFAGSAKDIGAVDATVAAALTIVPAKALLAGMFITACFISMAIGTSVGTIVALMPIATGIAETCQMNVAFVAALIVGGAFFGDNLSFISDTTIAATRSVGVEMREKFRANFFIVLPAVLAVLAIYVVKGWNMDIVPPAMEPNLLLVAPYVLVIVLALCGVDVTLILTIGIAVNAVIGFATGSFTWSGWLSSLGGGIATMNDLIVVTMLAGGLMEVIRYGGGLDYIIHILTANIRNRRGAKFCIAALVALVNLCTANNTIAIITTGSIANDITKRYGIDPRQTASLLDTFSCLVQGIIPYGAQLLMASGLAGVTASAIIPYLYYPYLLGISAIAFILFRK